jgi:hypothetical protein
MLLAWPLTLLLPCTSRILSALNHCNNLIRYSQDAAEAYSAASTSYASNSSKGIEDGNGFSLKSQEKVTLANSVASVQLFCEVTVLFLIVVTFVAVGVLSARRLRSSLLGVDNASSTAAAGRMLRLQMVGTTAFLFIAFVVRCAFSTMAAVASTFQSQEQEIVACRDLCGECHSVSYFISVWITYTPEFQAIVVLVSSPLALLISLWGMTSNSTLSLIKFSARRSGSVVSLSTSAKSTNHSVSISSSVPSR